MKPSKPDAKRPDKAVFETGQKARDNFLKAMGMIAPPVGKPGAVPEKKK